MAVAQITVAREIREEMQTEFERHVADKLTVVWLRKMPLDEVIGSRIEHFEAETAKLAQRARDAARVLSIAAANEGHEELKHGDR